MATATVTKPLEWKPDGKGGFRCHGPGRFEIEREGRRFVLWLADSWVVVGTLAVCRLAAEACRVLLDERLPKIEEEWDDRIVEAENGMEEACIDAMKAVSDEVFAEFKRKQKRKKAKAR